MCALCSRIANSAAGTISLYQAVAKGAYVLALPRLDARHRDEQQESESRQIGIDLGVIPPRIYDVPVLISIQADVINLTNGDRPPDGSVLVFIASGGSFVNGLTEIELGTVDGRVITELEIQLPGTYELEVEFPQESCTVSAVFSIGLE